MYLSVHFAPISYRMLPSGFELINLGELLEPLTHLAPPESSDDGLDPHDFLSQSLDSLSTGIRANTVSPSAVERLELTPTRLAEISASKLGWKTTPQDSVMSNMGDSLGDSVFFRGVAFSGRRTKGSDGFEQQPREFLQARQDALVTELRRHIHEHLELLSEGDDCTHIRAVLASDFDQLSETCLLLNEVSLREKEIAEELLADFSRWDKRREKVLQRVRAIKSENSKYGTKLAGLLRKKSLVESEIDQLEERIAALKAQKAAITKEIGETSSVLESKSAKYVHRFRELERKGRDVISDYLTFSGVPLQDLSLFLRSEKVDATFSLLDEKNTTNNATYNFSKSHPATNNLRDTNGAQNPVNGHPMGVQPLEIPTATNFDGTPNTVSLANSPYKLGYSRGAQSLERLKSGINGFVHNFVLPPKQPASKENVDDLLNTITEKINLLPTLELLKHKVEALEDLSLKSSRLSAFYNDQSIAWKSTCKTLSSQEGLVMSILNSSEPRTEELIERLKIAYSLIEEDLQKANNTHVSAATSKANWLGIIIHQELTALATAIDELTGNNDFVKHLPSVDRSITDLATTKINNDRLSMRITSAGYHPSTAPTTAPAKVFSSNNQEGLYAPRSKSMKSE